MHMYIKAYFSEINYKHCCNHSKTILESNENQTQLYTKVK